MGQGKGRKGEEREGERAREARQKVWGSVGKREAARSDGRRDQKDYKCSLNPPWKSFKNQSKIGDLCY